MIWPFVKLINVTSTARSYAVTFALATFGWAATGIHLLIFDPMVKARGSLAPLLELPADQGGRPPRARAQADFCMAASVRASRALIAS